MEVIKCLISNLFQILNKNTNKLKLKSTQDYIRYYEE
jgi:hypothetical protein